MILIEGLWYDIFVGLIVTLVAGSVGFIFQIFRYFKKRKRKKRITSFFGKDAEHAVIGLPVFHPLTTDQFYEEVEPPEPKTDMRKFKLDENTGEKKCEPIEIFDDKIDVGDYYGFEAVESLFVENGMTNVKFKSDEFLFDHHDWPEFPCIINIGGPGSNIKIDEIIKLPDAVKLFELEGAHEIKLDKWVMKIKNCGKQLEFRVDDNRAIGCIMRIPNPCQPQNYLIGLFGCRSQSTLMTCVYLKENIDKLNRIVKDMPFIALIGVTGPKLNIPERMLVSTYDRILSENRKETSKFLKNN